MLSPGKYHLLIPREREANLDARRKVYAAAAADLSLQRGLIDMCRQDILFYTNLFVWQFNPKKPPGERIGPFVTWDFQEKALMDRPDTTGERGILWCHEHGRTAVVEKSREMGASWLFLIFQDWLDLFHEYSQTLNISKSEKAVDSKSPDSLFWKIRFMHQWLPFWLRGEILEEKLFLEYKRTNSVTTGEASTGRAGVGGRAGAIFIDEFSQIREDVEVRQRTANTADCRFFNGTHIGVGTEFYRLTKSPEIIKIVMHWTQHPDKKKGMYRYDTVGNKIEILDKEYKFPPDYQFVMDGSPTGGPFPGVRSPWYDQKCKDIGTSRGVAMELDINPEGSVSQFFDALVIRQLQQEFCRPPDWEGDVDYELETGRLKGLTKRPNGFLRLWTVLDHHGKPHISKFGAGADVATGTGATPSCLSLGDGRRGEKILEYRNPFIAPEQFAALCVALCSTFVDEYGEGALLCWEMCGPGVAFGLRVIALGYRRVYYRSNELKPFSNPPNETPGWYPGHGPTSPKRYMLDDYYAALKNRECVNFSEPALNECLKFKFDKSGDVVHSQEDSTDDPSGARVNHADLGISDGLMWKMMKGDVQEFSKEESQEILPGSLAWRREYRYSKRRRRWA